MVLKFPKKPCIIPILRVFKTIVLAMQLLCLSRIIHLERHVQEGDRKSSLQGHGLWQFDFRADEDVVGIAEIVVSDNGVDRVLGAIEHQ